MHDEKLVALVAGVIGVWTVSVLILLVTLRLTLHVCVGISTAMVLIFLVALRRATLRFCASVRPFHILKTDQIDCEIRPPSDGVWHVLAFIWRVFGSGRLYQAFLRWLNRKYLHWDTRFEDLGQNAATEVLSYCRTYGVQVEPWVWEKSAGEYTTMNEWFTRKSSRTSSSTSATWASRSTSSTWSIRATSCTSRLQTTTATTHRLRARW
ncbi:hypothetical protein Ctob_002245 [Chrysochromulina tobinii]|uniref:Uncharacterized protein n=1 Tax=Chrysochromulina tobinii TaxID=1460289 RepID=A0A0M0JJC9_9EUKA|nr:hypothetical protein Ctob_002245 [Chrysochromulina tobinii]|eukprot:KOO26348.1 hypothetical protein Ctob_002245 [Chrysochromulina sp. CCMP291]